VTTLRRAGEAKPPDTKKTKRTGKTAMQHALNVALDLWPESPMLFAQKRIVRIPDRKRPGQWTLIALPEDLWSAFDMLVLTIPDPWLLQVTTHIEGGKSGNVTARKRKIEKNFLSKYPFPGARPHVEVWSWVARKYFYTWAWKWDAGIWGPRDVLHDPTMVGKGPSLAATQLLLDGDQDEPL
jgi:hypothetical protein